MHFVSEFISPEDIEKYGLKEIDEHFVVGHMPICDWIIDRDQNIYLRLVAQGGGGEPEIQHQHTWTLFWQGDLLTLRLDLIGGAGERGERGEPGWSHWKLIRINGDNGLPTHLQSQKNEIIETLVEALTIYKDGGVYSSNTDYRVIMDIGEDYSL